MTEITAQWGVSGEASDQASQLYIEFESALNSGNSPRIENYLEDTRGPNRSTLLKRLVMVELRHRFLAGETPTLEEYLERFKSERDTIQELQAYWEQLRQEMERSLAATAIARPERTLGRFQLLTKVGSGGFGEVWQAWDPQLKRIVAVKTLDPDKAVVSNLNLARHEACVAAQLNHPNIVSLHEYIESEEVTCLVSEFVEGTDLRALIKTGPINFVKAVDICRHIARGLHQAHQLGVIHRDIKPANILISLRGQPKLADFGVAHWQGAEGTLRNDHELIGTAVYMSPEQASYRKVVPESDIYSLGIVLYEMLTGQPPFTGAATSIIMGHQIRDPIPPRRIDRRIPRDLETICLKMLAKKARDRYRTADALAEDLDRFSFNLPPKAKRLNLFQKAWRRLSRKPRQTAAAAGTSATFALCLTGLALYGFQPPVDDGRREIHVSTDSPGALIQVQRRDDQTYAPNPLITEQLRSTPGVLRLKPGHYRVSAIHPETKKFIEVNRFVPDEDQNIPMQGTHNLYWRKKEDGIHWPTIETTPEGTPDSLVLIEGGTIEIVDPANPSTERKSVTVPSFYISWREFSVDDIVAIRPYFAGGGIEKLLGYRGSDPFRPLSLDMAEHWAEHYGCRLPTEIEYRYLMQQIKIPENWDRSDAVRYENEPWDYLPKYPSIRGIATGVTEWTGSYPLAFKKAAQPQLLCDPNDWRVAWGGNAPAGEIHGIADPEDAYRIFVKRFSQSRGMGFRLARSFPILEESDDD